MYNYRDIILFLNICRINNLKILNLISSSGMDKLLYLNEKSIDRIGIFTAAEKDKLKDKLNINIENYKHKLYQQGYEFLTILDINYPQNLKNIFNAPSIIYIKGKKIDRLNNSIAIVGTRKPTEYGRWVTKKIIKELKKYDLSIISGMALGIDYIAHREAIENDLCTAGILASSLDIVYPKTNIELYVDMENQILISEFPFTTEPIKRNFVMRNRIISGLSLGVLVIEAAENSGSLITANYAIEQNKGVFAIPGGIDSVYSKGTNNLIKNGAKIVQNAEDIVEELPFIKEVEKVLNISEREISNNEIKILEILSIKNTNINEIITLSNMDISECYASIMKLEMSGRIISLGNNFYGKVF